MDSPYICDCGRYRPPEQVQSRAYVWAKAKLLHGDDSEHTRLAEDTLFKCDDCILSERISLETST